MKFDFETAEYFQQHLRCSRYVVEVNIRISLWVNQVQICGYEIWNNFWCSENTTRLMKKGGNVYLHDYNYLQVIISNE